MAEKTKPRTRWEFSEKDFTLSGTLKDGNKVTVRLNDFPKPIQAQIAGQGMKTKFGSAGDKASFDKMVEQLKAGTWAVGPVGRAPNPRKQLARALVHVLEQSGKRYISKAVDGGGRHRSGISGANLDVAAMDDAKVKSSLELPKIKSALAALDSAEPAEGASVDDVLAS